MNERRRHKRARIPVPAISKAAEQSGPLNFAILLWLLRAGKNDGRQTSLEERTRGGTSRQSGRYR